MFYHVRITQKSNRTHDEVKLDLSKEKLSSQFIKQYENGDPIIINGKTIPLEDLERIRITETKKGSEQLLPQVKRERLQGGIIASISDEWYVADKGKDITDELITGPAGYKRKIRNKDKNIKISNRIFIVHGHNEVLKNDLEIFLKNIKLNPIILHKQVDTGLTIIEKLEKFADVGYAFILLTPDDTGCSVEEHKKEESEKKIEYRARQNVIFEFGYLVGRLGRNRVCCMYKEPVALPTDISGLLYKKITNSVEGIGYSIIKELKAAGYKPEL